MCHSLVTRLRKVAKNKASYLSDGNSVFLSALETLHRRLSVKPQPFPSGVIVAIGYPLPPDSETVMDPRRTRDLTPPSPGCGTDEGGADDFARFIQQRVKPIVHKRIKELRGAVPGKEALFGHSLGGLFALHLLFTKSALFDCFIASSPSIWWDNEFILSELSEYLRRGEKATDKSLMLFVGGLEENPRQRRGESDEDYQKKKKRHQDRKMKQNLFAVHRRLEKSRKLKHLSAKIYEGEDHGTVIPCSLSQSLATFFEDWPFPEMMESTELMERFM